MLDPTPSLVDAFADQCISTAKALYANGNALLRQVAEVEFEDPEDVKAVAKALAAGERAEGTLDGAFPDGDGEQPTAG